jgi:hypothetical protein
MTSEVRLKLELSEAQTEIHRLKDRLATVLWLSSKIFLWYPALLDGQARNQPSHWRNVSPVSKAQQGEDNGYKRTVFK